MTCTSLGIAGFKPEMKQLTTNGAGRPMTRFARASNSDKYTETVDCSVNLQSSPVGSSYVEDENHA